jgi:glyoxylase-like metal-dependent hydrolase (beta-lactamase superfamily II)
MRLLINAFDVAIIAVALTVAVSVPADAQTIAHVAGNVYKVQSGPDVTLFLVTSEGIVLIDPLSDSTARWLNAEFASRFPDRPVRYVLYSHHHFDRASGGSVYDNSAEVVAQVEFAEERHASALVLPPAFESLDRNANKVLERAEYAGAVSESAIAVYDFNGDGTVTPTEFYSHVKSPDTTFRSRRTISLGGGRLELIHVRSAHSRDATIMYFPAERLLFAVDALPIGSLPAPFGAAAANAVLELTQTLEALDFDMVLTGRGEVGTKSDVTALGQYVQDLVAGVKAGINAGRSVDEISKTLTLDNYSGFSNYASQRTANISDIFASLPRISFDIYTAGHLNARQAGSGCSGFCGTVGGAALAASTGVGVSTGRVLFSVEIMAERIATARIPPRTNVAPRLISDGRVTQRQDSAVSFLFGYDVVKTRRAVLGLDAGASLITSRIGQTDVIPFDRLIFEESQSTSLGFTFGMRLFIPVTEKLSLVTPVRLTKSDPQDHTGSFGVSAGAGIRLTLARRSL